MSSTHNSNLITKILIDYSVYEKLKKCEKDIEEIHDKKKEELKIIPDTTEETLGELQQPNQQGGGYLMSDEKKSESNLTTQTLQNVVDEIVSKVTKNLIEHLDVQKVAQKDSQVGEGGDLLPQTANFVKHNISQPSSSDSLTIKSTQHDHFDDQKLLNLIPQQFKKRAEILLNNIKSDPLQIDFNTKGELFIDTQSVPDANIYCVFPELFVRKKKKLTLGLSELATKIARLGWGHLINKGIAKGLKRPKNYKIHEKTEHSLKEFKNWWYMSM